MVTKLQQANPHIQIHTTAHPSFGRFAMAVEPQPLAPLFRQLEQSTQIPSHGNRYVASVSQWEQGPAFDYLQGNYYAGMPIQIGYCNGKNQLLNALEYHRGCEVTLAGTDLVLLLAHFSDIENGRLDSEVVKAYYIAKGESFALYESTLHFSPCGVYPTGFRAGIVLPRGTNTPYRHGKENAFWQDTLQFMRNKWLIAHRDSAVAREKGAYVGIDGENIVIHPV